MLGQVVVAEKIPAGMKGWTLNVENLPAGMYFLQVNNHVQKIVKW